MANDKVKSRMQMYEKAFSDLHARQLQIGEQVERLQAEGRAIEVKKAELQGRFQELKELCEAEPTPAPTALPHVDEPKEETKE